MKHVKLIFLAVAAFILMAPACNKDDSDVLPPATQSGANTFGCLVNKKPFVPNKSHEFTGVVEGDTISVYGHYSGTENSSDRIVAIRRSGVKNIHYIHVYAYRLIFKGAGIYDLDDAHYDWFNYPFHSYIMCRAVSPITGKFKYYGSYKNSGKIVITRKDADNRIFSGTFSGKLKEKDGEEIIEISEGRFDINLKKLKI